MKNAAQTECFCEARAFILMSSLKLMGSHQTAKQSQPALTSPNSLSPAIDTVLCVSVSAYTDFVPSQFPMRWNGVFDAASVFYGADSNTFESLNILLSLSSASVRAHSSHIHVIMHAYVSKWFVTLKHNRTLDFVCCRAKAPQMMLKFSLVNLSSCVM